MPIVFHLTLNLSCLKNKSKHVGAFVVDLFGKPWQLPPQQGFQEQQLSEPLYCLNSDSWRGSLAVHLSDNLTQAFICLFFIRKRPTVGPRQHRKTVLLVGSQQSSTPAPGAGQVLAGPLQARGISCPRAQVAVVTYSVVPTVDPTAPKSSPCAPPCTWYLPAGKPWPSPQLRESAQVTGEHTQAPLQPPAS